MLKMGDEDLVAFLDIAPAPALGDEIDAFGGAAHENDVAHGGRVEEAPHFFARRFVGVGGAGRERMRGAMDVGVFVLVEIREMRSMTACGFCVVAALSSQISGLPLRALQDREIALDPIRVERLGGQFRVRQ